MSIIMLIQQSYFGTICFLMCVSNTSYVRVYNNNYFIYILPEKISSDLIIYNKLLFSTIIPKVES